jgi:hypothetical protein
MINLLSCAFHYFLRIVIPYLCEKRSPYRLDFSDAGGLDESVELVSLHPRIHN